MRAGEGRRGGSPETLERSNPRATTVQSSSHAPRSAASEQHCCVRLHPAAGRPWPHQRLGLE